MDAQVEFVEFQKNNFKGYTLIEGFPGMGLVGTIAAKYIIEKLKFDYVGYVDANIFMPIIRIHKALPIRPCRIYVNQSKKLVVLISEQVIAKQFTSLVAKKTVKWIKEKEFKEIISLSGVHASGEQKREMIYGIAANEKSKALLKKYKLIEIEEGITTGITALILMELTNTKLEAISILGNVQVSADYKASAEVVKKLNEILKLTLNVDPLLKEAKETEKQLIQQLQQLKDTKDNTEKFETRTPIIT